MSQLLRDALAGQFERLMIDRTDRLSRGGTGQYGRFVDQLKEAGVRLHFAMENFDPATDEGDLIGVIYAHQARKANSDRVRLRLQTFERKVRDGHYICGRRPPFGYTWAPERHPDGRLKKHHLIEDPVTEPIVRHLFSE